jgi:Uma2 family endonuclease
MPKPAGSSALKDGGRFTLEQRLAWPEDERWELIGGVAYNMCESASTRHQRMAGMLIKALHTFLDGKPCEFFFAPLDVFLPDGDEESTDTVVIPDVLVVCDPGKIKENGIHGAPDFIAELLSPSTAYKDLSNKKTLYERAGVREYWIINPDTGSVFPYVLKDGSYGAALEVLRGESVESAALPGFVWRVV